MHESFHSQLERSEDGFTWVADYFGRGIFNRLTLVTDSPPKSRITDSLKDSTYASGETRKREEASLPSVSALAENSRIPSLNLEEQISSSKMTASNINTSMTKRTQLGLSCGQIQYSSSLEANMTRGSHQLSVHKGKGTHSANPFGDDDDSIQEGLRYSGQGLGYDESKNPFAEDLTNPFEADDDVNHKNKNIDSDYDRNLNPFA
ncbi:hypothetical protein J437_LFUL018174 [Ladona fulva]|uniref:Vacuolar protein sorting protein 11 C-terminal domain-containing protein n=1 Tax=Ladona fulva TaxID=123851 RepID=A0A8K0KPS7_LADFU|nr:hypothetical protein J437_LFUL018174 [Ladona fulva]